MCVVGIEFRLPLSTLFMCVVGIEFRLALSTLVICVVGIEFRRLSEQVAGQDMAAEAPV